MAQQDHYLVLGVPETASPSEIKEAFRRLAFAYHPDYNPGDPTAEARFKSINEAYQCLDDEDARAFYDASRRAPKRVARRAAPSRPRPTNVVYRAHRWFDDLEREGRGAERFVLFLLVIIGLLVIPGLIALLLGYPSDYGQAIGMLGMCVLGLTRMYYFSR